MLRFAPRKPVRPALQLTSLIDVVFLLLIFFLLTSSFVEQEGIDVDLPDISSATDELLPELIVNVDSNGVFYFDEREVDDEELFARLAVKLESAASDAVFIRADRRVPYDFVVQAMDIAKQAGAKQLLLVTEHRVEE
jgi:biopolymer transport protein ExbD